MEYTVVLVFLCHISYAANALRPLVFIHGLMGHTEDFDKFKSFLEKDFPGIKIFCLDDFTELDSIKLLTDQIPTFEERIRDISDHYGKITLVGFSQGGFIARALLQLADDLPIHTLISLAAPGVGQYGVSEKHGSFVRNRASNAISKLCYDKQLRSWKKPIVAKMIEGKIGVKKEEHPEIYEEVYVGRISLCEFWRDPTTRFYDQYLQASPLVALLNNEVDHPGSETVKKNFLKVRRLVLVGGQDEQVVKPRVSSFYGYLDENLEVVPTFDYFLYTNDTFGLKTLNEKGRLTLCSVDGLKHRAFVESFKSYEKCVKPYIG